MAGVKFPRLGLFFMDQNICHRCSRFSSTLHYEDGQWVCRQCYTLPVSESCRFFEYGHVNPIDPKGSTAHVRDIKDRRWHPKEKRLFYYSKELGKKYFFLK